MATEPLKSRTNLAKVRLQKVKKKKKEKKGSRVPSESGDFDDKKL